LNVFIFAAIIFSTMAENKDTGALQYNNQSQKPLLSFGVLADIQYCDSDPVGTRFYRSSLNKLKEALTTLKADSVDFIINLGDIIDKDLDSYKTVLDIIGSSGLKTYHVTGNHDYSVDARQKKRIPAITESREGYYSVLYKNFRFIFLNGNEISTYISNSKSDLKEANNYIASMKERGEINAVEWNGGIGDKQLIWLRKQMNSSVTKNEKVILICHFPLVPYNVHNLLNYNEVLSVLGNYHNIIAWFNGHNHAGNYGNFNMIHFVTFKGMVETDLSNSFALVEIYRNKLWIKGYGREKSQILAF